MPLFCGNGERVIIIYAPNKTVQTCQAKIGDNEPILIFGGSLFVHPPHDILIKHNIKETANKGNIWGSFYIPTVKGSGGGLRK